MFQVPCFNFVYFYIHLMELDSFRLSTLLTTLINARVCKFSSCLMILSLSRSCFFLKKLKPKNRIYNNIVAGSSMCLRKYCSHLAPTAPSTVRWSALIVTEMKVLSLNLKWWLELLIDQWLTTQCLLTLSRSFRRAKVAFVDLQRRECTIAVD